MAGVKQGQTGANSDCFDDHSWVAELHRRRERARASSLDSSDPFQTKRHVRGCSVSAMFSTFSRTVARSSLTRRWLSQVSHGQLEHIIVSKPHPTVSLITLNRPKALNALSSPLFAELNQSLKQADEDTEIGAVVLTGSEKAFAGEWVSRAPPLTEIKYPG